MDRMTLNHHLQVRRANRSTWQATLTFSESPHCDKEWVQHRVIKNGIAATLYSRPGSPTVDVTVMADDPEVAIDRLWEAVSGLGAWAWGREPVQEPTPDIRTALEWAATFAEGSRDADDPSLDWPVFNRRLREFRRAIERAVQMEQALTDVIDALETYRVQMCSTPRCDRPTDPTALLPQLRNAMENK